MKIERLRNKKSKLIFLCGCLMVVVLLITIVFNGSRAKYRSSQIIPLITNKSITNKVPSFTTMGIYLEDTTGTEVKNGKKYKKQETIPSEGFIINETNSYCEKFNSATNTNEKNNNAKLYTNILGKHSMEGINKGDKCYIYFDKGEVSNRIYAKDFLLSKWGYLGQNITERPASDFTGTTKVMITGRDTANDRDYVYKAPDDDGTSYYLAGNPKYNWVKFGGHYWRIVRINGDGTIRMIYSGTSKAEEKGTGTQVTTVAYNEIYNNAVYVGYWWTEKQLHGFTIASLIYWHVEYFYRNRISEVDKKYIDENAGFCNDRTLSTSSSSVGFGEGSDMTYYAGYERLYEDMRVPILTCPDKTNDLFTATSSTKGNKVLGSPIGMITADEVVLAGLLSYSYGVTDKNYLHTGLEYYTITPLFYNKYTTFVYVGGVKADGGLVGSLTHSSSVGLRPVINLIKDITFSKGNGTKEFPFEI